MMSGVLVDVYRQLAQMCALPNSAFALPSSSLCTLHSSFFVSFENTPGLLGLGSFVGVSSMPLLVHSRSPSASTRVVSTEFRLLPILLGVLGPISESSSCMSSKLTRLDTVLLVEGSCNVRLSSDEAGGMS